MKLSSLYLYRNLAIALALSVGVGLSGVAAIFVGKWETVNSQIRFQRQIENLATALQRSLNRYTEVLLSNGDFYAAADQQISRQQFARLVQRSIHSYPGIQALEWAPTVRQADRLAYERQIQSEGYPGFQITELVAGNLVRAGDRPSYSPVTYVEPLEGNQAALGFDLASNPTRLAAMDIARDSGQIIATGRIRLVQEQKNQFGFLVFLPLYRRAVTSLPERREALQGFLLGVFRVSDLVEESLQSLNYEIDFYLSDQTAIDPNERFLGFYAADLKTVVAASDRPTSPPQTTALCPASSDCTRFFSVGGRQWSVRFAPASTYGQNLPYGTIATLGIGLLLTLSLVSLLANLGNELIRTRELSELKLRFFSMASHELRTPLSVILLSSQSLAVNQEMLSAEQKHKNLQRIQSAAQRMNQLIADILTLTRAEVGKLEFTPELFDLKEFCQQIVEEMQANADQEILFVSHCPDPRVYLDKKLIRSLLTNLLSNAIKYSSVADPIALTLTGNTAQVRMQVSDRGIGIAADDLLHLCNPFYRGKNVGEVAGVGLGLAVVKTCVDLHQGQLAIESEVEQGTTITVTLPIG